MGPQRTCIGCRKVKEKSDLLRFVINTGGELVCDLEKRLNGRGAYLCRDKNCIRVALKKKRFTYAFKKGR
ncbi:MAG: YlxR family protein [Thermodesulfobacteriota bacterium]